MTISLNGQWILTCVQRAAIQDITVELPGDVHSALLEAGEIPDPHWATNEDKVQWIRECDWLVSRSFQLTEEQLTCQAMDLVLHDLESIVEIRVNGHTVADFNNMFIRHKVEILPCLKVGLNHIEMVLRHQDPTQVALDKLAFNMPIDEQGTAQIDLNALRQSSCLSSSFWGVNIPVIGVFDDIELQPLQQIRVSHISTKQNWQESGCELAVTLHYEAVTSRGLAIAEVTFDDQTFHLTLDRDAEQASVLFRIDNPRLWWPAGYGQPRLYDLRVEVDGQLIEQKIGLRKLEVVTEPNEQGHNFSVKVNDELIKVRGTNWLPLDALPGRMTAERYQKLLADAAEANMNMVRVWGGGRYEKEIFYRQCDALGLLVWQDVMFSDAFMLPTPDVMTEVKEELLWQARRLKNHSCIALWGGDNPIVDGIYQQLPNRQERDKYLSNYDRLMRNIRQVLEQEDPKRLFWVSASYYDDSEHCRPWQDLDSGDCHYWDIWHQGLDYVHSRKHIPNFCSEFGFQSWPSLPTVRTIAPEKHWNISSPSMEQHQRNGKGNATIVDMFTRNYRFPDGFANMLYLSQVQQAIVTKTAVEAWRLQEKNTGMLLWQLNDFSPQSSCSSVEYNGRWKPLHYHAKRFFAPLTATFMADNDGVKLYLLNDSRRGEVLKGEVVWQSWEGEILFRDPVNQYLEPGKCLSVWEWLTEDLAGREEEGFFHVHLRQGANIIENTWFPKRLKHCELADPDLRYEVAEIDNQLYVMITSSKPAFFVHLEYQGAGHFSDSSFTLVPEHQRQIKYTGPATLEELTAGLTVYHLRNSY
ncbi:TPA: beta-mannosidase [Photobacterium damselae]